MTISFSPIVQLVYPERRKVPAAWIMSRWYDAVANGEVYRRFSREPTLAEAIYDLEDIGQITTDGQPV